MVSSLLARRVLSSLGVRIAIVTIIFSGLSYYLSYTRFQAETEQRLAHFIRSRSQLESDLFLQAQKNVILVRNSFLRHLEQNKNVPAEPRFSQMIVRNADGIWRLRQQYGDHRYNATVSIFPEAGLDDQFKRKVLAAHDVISQFGPAFRLRYNSTFIDLGENEATILYSPDVNYARAIAWHKTHDEGADAPAYGAGSTENIQKDKVYWTDIYYDQQTMQWTVSVIAPIMDNQHRIYGRAGMDVLLSQLINYVEATSIIGAYSMIIGKNGELIAHSDKMQQIRNANGYLPISQLQDAELTQIYDAVKYNKTTKDLLKTRDGKLLLGVVQLQGTKWLLVTAYPKKLLQKKAAGAASIVLVLGVVSLLIQIFFIAKVLKKNIARPLHALQEEVNKLARGEGEIQLNNQRQDEFGALARAFALMADKVRRYEDEQEMLVKVRTDTLTQHNQALTEANAALVQLDQKKNNILMVVAHQIKGPVGNIKAIAEQLTYRLATWPQEKMHSKLEVIDSLCVHLLRLVENLLDAHMLEDGQYPVSLQPVSLQEILQELRQYYQSILEQKQQVLMVQSTDVKVYADKSALWQVLDNLLSNACKYTPAHGTITIQVTGAGKEVYICIEDEGPGISLHEIDRLFQKFTQLPSHWTKAEYSVGLGLFVSAHLLHLMQGEIRCESQLGQGAKLIITLPGAPDGREQGSVS